MIPVPSKKFLILFALPLILFIMGLFHVSIALLGIFADSIILLTALLEILPARNVNLVLINPEKERTFSIGRENSLNLQLINHDNQCYKLYATIDLPKNWQDCTNYALHFVPSHTIKELTFRLKPLRRGVFPIVWFYTKRKTRFGLFFIYDRYKIDCTVQVYPDIKELNYYLQLTRKNRLYQMGIYKNRWIGQGKELESLRDYSKDDDSKNIEWKVTTRIQKPVTKVFQMETNTCLTLVLDCGRIMTAEQDGLNALDHAINGSLILAHVASRLGDSIHLIAFADKIISEMPPAKGKGSVKKIVRFLTTLEPQFVESNYKLVFEYLRSKIKKRSLIIFFTDIMDDINYDLFKCYLGFLNKRHRTLFILLRDVLLIRQIDKQVTGLDDLFITSSAREVFLQRAKTISKLKLNGFYILDVLPKHVTPQLINRYLEIKSKNLI